MCSSFPPHKTRLTVYYYCFFFFSEQTVSRPLSQSAQLVVKRGRDHFFWLVAFFFFFISALLGMKSCNPQWRFFFFACGFFFFWRGCSSDRKAIFSSSLYSRAPPLTLESGAFCILLNAVFLSTSLTRNERRGKRRAPSFTVSLDLEKLYSGKIENGSSFVSLCFFLLFLLLRISSFLPNVEHCEAQR